METKCTCFLRGPQTLNTHTMPIKLESGDKWNLVQEWQAEHQVMGAHGCGGTAGPGLACRAMG